MVEGDEQRLRHLDLRNELGLPTVSIRESTDFAKDDDLAIFPPTNHENLYIDGFNKDREFPSESSSPLSSSRLSDSSLSPSDSDTGQFEVDRKSHPHLSDAVGKSMNHYSILDTWKLLLAQLLSRFQKLATTCFSSNSLCSLSRTLQSYYPILGIVIWWWMRNRARRRLHEGEMTHLRNTIKDRDERIVQLLHHIAQTNELLVKKTHSN
ncbi:unnamed protein product [Microthlaspi erraticum]|uniref:Uncharacterized protein n=1 Tax=Microthlaspi erraticum TaxID=1685480 RepID=A0A6D2I475_9BRAS|nr:unnamed protein product [Microthlaspi erraticum]